MATYYIDPTGNDTTGDGSSGNPWASLYKATSVVTSAGNTIYVNAGTYTETNQSVLAVGVSILGAGATSIIDFTYVSGTNFCIYAYSSSLTNGNQSISYVKITGSDHTAYGGVYVHKRNNFKIHHCTFENFNKWGVRFIYPYSQGYENPTEFCTGNEFRYNIVRDCAGNNGGVDSCFGALGIDGQDGILVEYNNFYQDRTAGSNGMPIKGVTGINRGIKIRYNNIYMGLFETGDYWDFAIELWDCRGGVEISYNYLEGSIDIGGVRNLKGSSEYSAWVHNNTIKQVSQAVREGTRGLIIEGTVRNEDIIFEKNHVLNTCAGVIWNIVGGSMSSERVKIRYNIFESMGLDDSQATNYKGWGIRGDASSNGTIDDVEIYNNVFTAKEGTYSTMWGIMIFPQIITNYKIKNNIVIGFDYAGVFGYNNGDSYITCDYLWIQNNIFYGNGNSNLPRYNGDYAPTNNTTENNITTDPLFVSSTNYRLQSESPAIDAGIDVGLTRDYDDKGVPYNGVPDIGAYEYGALDPDIVITRARINKYSVA